MYTYIQTCINTYTDICVYIYIQYEPGRKYSRLNRGPWLHPYSSSSPEPSAQRRPVEIVSTSLAQPSVNRARHWGSKQTGEALIQVLSI